MTLRYLGTASVPFTEDGQRHVLDYCCEVLEDTETGYQEYRNGRYEIDGQETDPDTLRCLFSHYTTTFLFCDIEQTLKLQPLNMRNPDDV